MTRVIAIMSMSLDGYVADANDGVGEVFDWYFSGDVEVPTASASSGMTFRVSPPSAEHLRGVVAEICAMLTGRRTFEVAGGWGGQHPWDIPAFVATHHVPDGWPRPGSTVQFVTDGIESAVARAKSTAGPKSVGVHGAQKRVAHLDDIERRDRDIPVREHLGIHAYGINAYTPGEDGALIGEHDESGSGQEELYIVLDGNPTFEVDGEAVDARPGTLVFVRPASRRKATGAIHRTLLQPDLSCQLFTRHYTSRSAPVRLEGEMRNLEPSRSGRSDTGLLREHWRQCPPGLRTIRATGFAGPSADRVPRAVAERVLTLRELNRATLARQLLLHRTRLSPTAVIERLVGMQAQSPQAPYVGIWTRTTGFRRRSLERLLRQSAIVRATGTRQTLHLVTRRDYALIRAAFPWETKQAKQLAPSVRALAAGGPVTSAEALAHLESEYGLAGVDARRAWQMARVAAHIVHHPETALWQPRNERRFVAIEEPAHVPIEARAEIFRRYLAAFGPSTRRDIGAWSMIRVAEIDAALELLEPLRRFRDEQGRELLDVPRAPLTDAETPAPVRFLPKWDNVLLAWADRTRVLPEQYRKTVIKMNGDVAQTFLVDGFVAGIWRVDDGRVVLEPFEPLSAAARREIEDEAGRLEAFLAEP